jgi:hypothetical protein
VAILFAYATMELSCDYYGCERPAIDYIQFAVACIGGVPVGALVWATVTRRKQVAALALLLAVLCYALWGVLNDRAVHGEHGSALAPARWLASYPSPS